MYLIFTPNALYQRRIPNEFRVKQYKSCPRTLLFHIHIIYEHGKNPFVIFLWIHEYDPSRPGYPRDSAISNNRFSGLCYDSISCVKPGTF